MRLRQILTCRFTRSGAPTCRLSTRLLDYLTHRTCFLISYFGFEAVLCKINNSNITVIFHLGCEEEDADERNEVFGQVRLSTRGIAASLIIKDIEPDTKLEREYMRRTVQSWTVTSSPGIEVNCLIKQDIVEPLIHKLSRSYTLTRQGRWIPRTRF